jgi:hypothetical protein
VQVFSFGHPHSHVSGSRAFVPGHGDDSLHSIKHVFGFHFLLDGIVIGIEFLHSQLQELSLNSLLVAQDSVFSQRHRHSLSKYLLK